MNPRPPYQAVSGDLAPRPASSLDALMDRMTVVCFSVAAMLLMLVGGIRITGTIPFAPKTARANIYTYTDNENWLSAIVNEGYNWPEQKDNWCGVASIQAMNAYAYHQQGIDSQNNYSTQQAMANLLNSSSAQSPWGTSYDGGGFTADIAADQGSDPRSLAWGIYTASPYGYYYHNYIYPATNGVYAATQSFASDYGSNGVNNPITVTINGGSHSIVVGGVQADRDPSVDPTNATIYNIDVWDPWYGANYGNYDYYNDQGVQQWQPMSDWETKTKWWGIGYDTSNGYDPDPDTNPGNYYNTTSTTSPSGGALSWHWNGQYVTVEQDNIAPSTYDENIALNNLGKPVPHTCGTAMC